MNIESTIASWIKEARTGAGLSGDALATKLTFELGEARGNTKANISHWETGKHSPSLAQIMAIVKVTNYSLPAAVLSKLTAFNSDAPQVLDSAVEKGVATLVHEVDSAVKRRAHVQWVGDDEADVLDAYRTTDNEGRQSIQIAAGSVTRFALQSVINNKQ